MKNLMFAICLFVSFNMFANEAIVRERSTNVSPFSKSLKSSTKARASMTQSVDLIDCFEDERFEVVYTAEKRMPLGAIVKQGLLKKYDLSSVNYVETPTGILCTIDDYENQFFYVISQDQTGVFKITKEDKTLRGPREPLSLNPRGTSMRDFARFEPNSKLSLNSNEKISVDVMVVYDYSARAWCRRGKMNETTHASSLITQSNTILKNSGIESFEFSLVSVFPANFDFTSKFRNEPDFNDKTYDRFFYWLETIQGGTHGAAKEIRAERKRTGADVVSVVIYTGRSYGYVGMGYALYKGAVDFKKSAFSLTNAEVDASTFVHEIGHNMGAGHARGQSSEGPQYHPYSAGYYGANFHTIMAYNVDNNGTQYRPIPVFSSSSTNYKETPIGHALADNARTLTELAPMVSQFAKSVASEFVVYGCVGTYDDRIRLAWTKIPGVAFYHVKDEKLNLLKTTSSTSFTLKVADSEIRTFTIQPVNRLMHPWQTEATIDAVAKVCASPKWIKSTDTTFIGAAISLDEPILPYDAPTVEKTPSFYLRYQDPFTLKMKKSAVVSRMPASRFAPINKFYVETVGKINRANRKLINQSLRDGKSFASLYGDVTFQETLKAYMFIKYKHVPFYTQTKLALTVATPEIESLTPVYHASKKRWEIEIKGRYFSRKKPSIKLEYQYKNRLKTRSLSVISKPTFPNVRGQFNQSYCDVSTGESRLTIALPEKYLLNQSEPYTLVLDNGNAFTFKTFTLPR